MDTTYTAKFEEKGENERSLILRADPTNAGIIQGTGTYNKGTSVSATAIPKSGYKFVAWYQGTSVVSNNRIYKFTITEDTTLIATFEKVSSPIPVDPSGGGGGGGSGIPDSDTIPTDDHYNPSAGIGAAAGLYTVWCPTKAQFAAFGQYMWSDSWTDAITQALSHLGSLNGNMPTDYIYKAFRLPVYVPDSYRTKGESMNIGYYKNWYPAQESYQMDYTTIWGMIIDLGDISIPRYYGNALDYRMQIQLYLPYIGYVPIDAVSVVGKTLHLEYTIAFATGDFVAHVYVDGTEHYQFAGNMALDMPVSKDSTQENALSTIATKVAGATVGGVIGG